MEGQIKGHMEDDLQLDILEPAGALTKSNSRAFAITSRVGVWGLLGGVTGAFASLFGADVAGSAVWLLAGGGTLLGGLGIAAASLLVLRKMRTVNWKGRFGALIGVPFGLSAAVTAMGWLLPDMASLVPGSAWIYGIMNFAAGDDGATGTGSRGPGRHRDPRVPPRSVSRGGPRRVGCSPYLHSARSTLRQIVCISATSRPDNFTSRAVGIVVDELTLLGLSPELIDARELTLAFPGLPPTEDAERLRAAVEGADGVLLATPEYHGGYSAMTKLIIENLGFPSVLAGKPIALLGVAAGRIGAIKALEQLRAVCAHVGGLVLPGAVSVAGVQGAFDADGQCTDEGIEAALRGIGTALQGFIRDYVCPKYALEAMVREGQDPWSCTV